MSTSPPAPAPPNPATPVPGPSAPLSTEAEASAPGMNFRVAWRPGRWTLTPDTPSAAPSHATSGPSSRPPGAPANAPETAPHATRLSLVDLVAVVGGSVGLVYLVGYLVLAAHQRALGLPVRSSDTPVLLAGAWEFALRGTLLVFITLVGWIGQAATLAMLLATLALAIALFLLLRRQRARLAALVALLLAAGSVWLFAERTIPLMGIQNLLFARGQASPFEALPPWVSRHLATRLQDLQSSLTGADLRADVAAYGDPDRRARLFTGQVLITFACLGACMWTWRQRGRQPEPHRTHDGTHDGTHGRAPRWSARLLLGLTIAHALCAPIYYGVLLKSYRYPQVQLTLTPAGHADIDALYADYPSRFLFLVDTTDQELYLYDRDSRQLSLVRRDKLAHLRIVDSDFVLGGE